MSSRASIRSALKIRFTSSNASNMPMSRSMGTATKRSETGPCVFERRAKGRNSASRQPRQASPYGAAPASTVINVASALAHQKRRHRSDVLRRGQASQRAAADDALALGSFEPARHLSVDEAGRDRIDVHADAPDFACERLGEADEGRSVAA